MVKEMAIRKIQSRLPVLSCDLDKSAASGRHQSALVYQHFDKGGFFAQHASRFLFSPRPHPLLNLFPKQAAKWLLLLQVQQSSAWKGQHLVLSSMSGEFTSSGLLVE